MTAKIRSWIIGQLWKNMEALNLSWGQYQDLIEELHKIPLEDDVEQ